MIGAGEDRRREMISTKLHPYMVFDGGDPEEGACLVFAHNAREARLIGFPTVSMWSDANGSNAIPGVSGITISFSARPIRKNSLRTSRIASNHRRCARRVECGAVK